MSSPTLRRASRFTCCLLLAGCVGDVGDTKEEPEQAPGLICVADQVAPGPSPIRRLTRVEYNNTVRDLLGDTTEPANVFPAEEEALGFGNNAQALTVTPILAEKYMATAEAVARRATSNVTGLTGCKATDDAALRDECVQTFIHTFGKRVFRRPVTGPEANQLFAMYQSAFTIYADAPDPRNTPFREGVAMVIESMLQSPAFLYRVELGEGAAPLSEPFRSESDPAIVHLTSWEMASRLSYFLWGSTPDDELLAAAEADELLTSEQIAAQARRMLESERARQAVATFHSEWLDYDRIGTVTKDMSAYPEWSSAIGEAMKEEMRVFIDQVIFEGEGDLQTLLTAPYSYGSPELLALYGAEAPEEPGIYRVDFDPQEHAGLLTMGAILAYYSHTNQTSPVHRGKLVREMFLCDVLAPPPNDVDFEVPEPSPDATTRERFAQHSYDPACAGCHSLMDPIGFGFENFDTLGRFRSTENGKPIDASGKLTATDVDGTFVGVRELAERLAASDEVKSCYTKMWFRWAYGRVETEEDACTLSQIDESFAEAKGNVKELLVALTQTDAFRYRRLAAGEGE